MGILLITAIVFLVLLVGLLLAFLLSRTDRAVSGMRAEIAAEEKAYNPGMTLGHRIKPQADYDQQLKQARKAAAKQAAAVPRGANNRIGRDGASTLTTAGKNVKSDPQTAVRIARFHGWDGARNGIPAAGAAAAPAAAAPAAAARPGPVAATAGIAPPKLIEITDTMAPEEVRKARIANSKAEAAYNKALKAATSGATVPAAPVAVTAAAPPAGAPVAIGVEPPKLIEITPGMAPEEVRKARVSNAKAEAAYNKALKAAGVSAAAPAAAAVVEAPSPVEATAPVAAAPFVAVEPPKLVEITDAMSPEEVRKARVANAKAESAYNKALKAAGVDPASLKGGAAVATAVQMQAAAPAAPAEAAATPAAAPEAAPSMTAGIAPPTLIEITDSMSPEQIRRARVENAKATAAYNKALKAAGIDPASLK